MELVLERWPGRILVAAVAVAITAPLSMDLWRHAQADRLAREGSISSLQQAVRLEPRNADLHWRLGRAELFSEGGNTPAAVTALQEAASLNPAVGAYWVDLALAREGQGDTSAAGSALTRARAAEPRTPEILWESMNFALRDDHPEQAMQFAHALLEAAPPYAARALSQLGSVADAPSMIEGVLPADQGAMDVATAYVANRSDLPGEQAAWNKVMATGQPPSASSLRYFLDSLIWQGEGPLAERVWTDSIRRGWIAADAEALAEPLYNGSFRTPMLGFGFDWKVLPLEETSVWVSDEGPQPGQPCLCVDFSANARADFGHVSHAVPVTPGQHYLLSAKMRVRHVVTSAGAYLSVSGFRASGVQPATTDPMVGSSGWEAVSTEYVPGAQTRIAQITLSRPGTGAADTPVSGQICLAEVQWQRLNPPPESASVRGHAAHEGMAR